MCFGTKQEAQLTTVSLKMITRLQRAGNLRTKDYRCSFDRRDKVFPGNPASTCVSNQNHINGGGGGGQDQLLMLSPEMLKSQIPMGGGGGVGHQPS